MPAQNVTNSNNIASFDFKETSDLCEGIFVVDLSPTIWIASGYNNVLGASVKITNPYGVIIKYPTTSGYDIYPPMTSSVEVDIPTQANNYQYGSYIVEVYLTDSNGTIYTLSKSVSISAPNPKNKNVNYGSLSATLDGNCVTGRVAIIADTVPTYKGSISESQVNAFTLKYPTVSEMAPETTSIGAFSAQLFEGEYRFEGTICAHYSLGDNVFANVNYRVKRYKTIRCLLDKSCVAARLAELQFQISQDCTDKEKIATQNTIINALLLLTVIDGLTHDGQDPSDYISQLETVLGCVCTCNCADGTPIIPTVITDDFVIEGCHVSLVVAGLTHTYTIENYVYITEITSNGGAIVITAPVLDDCTQTQTITFNIDVVYDQIKAQISNNSDDFFWATVVNNTLDGLDAECLGLTTEEINFLTIKQKLQAIIDKACEGADCNAFIRIPILTNIGADVIIAWQSVSDVYNVDVYMDNILVGAVLDPTHQFTIVGAADGNAHDYTLISRCSNGGAGTVLTGSFTYFGCASIAAPTVTDTEVEEDCPFDLTSLVNSLPSPIIAEWHNAYNTLTSSLTATPTAAASGVYYVYGKNPTTGCYSTIATRVVLTCTEDTACSAPQNLIVEAITGGFRARFQSAAYPPPSNSYTVKRRITSDPDTGGSYTTIGTPTWDASSSRWQILDATAVNNVSYTYRAISNCASTEPYVDYIFANIVCPTLTLTPDTTTMGYSFVGAGGSISKYEVRIYDATGITLIHTDTILPAFSNPITGTFVYLSTDTEYRVQIRAYIGSYYTTCAAVYGTTTGYNLWVVNGFNQDSNSINSVTGISYTIGSGAFPLYGEGGSVYGVHSGFTAAIAVNITNPVSVAVGTVRLYVNDVLEECIELSSGTATYTFGSITVDESDTVYILYFDDNCGV